MTITIGSIILVALTSAIGACGFQASADSTDEAYDIEEVVADLEAVADPVIRMESACGE